MIARPPFLMSVDLEEWSDARLAGVAPGAGDRLPRVLEAATDALLAMLASASARATFFTLGRVARRYPALVRRVALAHEIATHGETHTDLRRLGPEGLRLEIHASRALLQDLTGQPVIGFRAPNWSLAPCLDWALPVLEAEGIRYDSSLLPGGGLLFLAGRPGLPPGPAPLAGSSRLWEFPPTILRLPGMSFPAAGGAFLRMLPASFTMSVLERTRGRGDWPHVHLHPWEMDGIAGARSARGTLGFWRSTLLFAGARSTRAKLTRILERFQGEAIVDLFARLTAPEEAGLFGRRAGLGAA